MAKAYDERFKHTTIGEITLSYNPNVKVDTLRVDKVVDLDSQEPKVDLRVWTDNNMGKRPYNGPTKQGFRLDREQYIELRALTYELDNFFQVTDEDIANILIPNTAEPNLEAPNLDKVDVEELE